jgi:lycopene cyclase domain-containing protein
VTFTGFLVQFIGLPLLFLAGLLLYLQFRAERAPSLLGKWPVWAVIAGHAAIVVLYTAPWDNYLIAAEIITYNPHAIQGLKLGLVPIEKYIFLASQPILLGGLLTLLGRFRILAPRHLFVPAGKLRAAGAGMILMLWLASLLLLLSGPEQSTFLGLTGLWGFLPLLGQFAFGGDILWHYRRLLVWTLFPVLAFLTIGDAIIFQAGLWMIHPERHLGFYLSGVLPVEEMVYYALACSIALFGVVLMIAPETRRRIGL